MLQRASFNCIVFVVVIVALIFLSELESGPAIHRIRALKRSPRSCRERLFVFGVTYEPNHDRAKVAQQTWAQDFLPSGIPWYTNSSDDLLHTRVLNHANGMGYFDITWRMLEIWADVLNSNPGYDWYMRVWDDNFIHFNRVCALLEEYNAGASIELGHVYTAHVKRDFLPHMEHMIGGGATSITSRAANEALLRHLGDCASWIRDLPPLTPSGATCRWNCEDFYLSYCRLRLGTRLIEVPGFFSHSPSHSGWTDKDLACGYRLIDGEHSGGSNPISGVPITLHYLSAREMLHVHEVFTAANKFVGYDCALCGELFFLLSSAQPPLLLLSFLAKGGIKAV